MVKATDFSQRVRNRSRLSQGPSRTLNHPDDVLHNRNMNVAEKRTILAGWASDAHAVPNMPAMRQLESGAIVGVDTVLAALRALDGCQGTALQNQGERICPAKSRRTPLSRWRRSLRRHDDSDDSDPPPSHSGALPPRIASELLRRRDTAWGLVAA